jgi:MFS family permease
VLKFGGFFGVCIGTIVTATAETLATLIGGRFLLSFLSILATAAAPLYLTELASPQYRGTVPGIYNTLYCMVSAKGTAHVPTADLV